MPLPPFRKLNVQSDALLSRVQDNVDEVLRPITIVPILDGVLLTGIALDSTVTNYVSHNLGRTLIGWVLVRVRDDSTVWDAQDSNGNRANTLALECSADVVVDLWVF